MSQNQGSRGHWINPVLLAAIFLCLVTLIVQNLFHLHNKTGEEANGPSTRLSTNPPTSLLPPPVEDAPSTIPQTVEDPNQPPSAETPEGDLPPSRPEEDRSTVAPGVVLGVQTVAAGFGESPVTPQGWGGPVVGKVHLFGTPPPERPLPLDPVCAKLFTNVPPTTRFYVTGNAGELADVLVHVHDVTLNGQYVIPEEKVTLKAGNCTYDPYVLGIQTGQSLLLESVGQILDNVHLTTKTNQERNIAMLPDSASKEVVFQHEEVFVRAKCDIHPWQFSYIGVIPHPFFAVTDTNGQFSIRAGLPPGEYQLVAHHRKAGSQRQSFTVREGESTTVDFVLKVPE